MKRWMLAAVVPIMVVACRTIVGIDDLEGGEGPNRPGGGPEAGGPDSGDAGSHKPNDANQQLINQCVGKGDCPPCCKVSFGVGPTFDKARSPGKKCMCQPANCLSQCESDCADENADLGKAPDGGAPGSPTLCVICVDEKLKNGTAQCARSVCEEVGGGARDTCLDGLECLSKCGNL